MKATKVFEAKDHRWWILHDQRETRVIDSNVYVVESKDQAILLDPGGFEIFPQVFAALVEAVKPGSLQSAFVSHQDPDIASSLPLWHACNPSIQWHVPALWEGFIRHFGALDAPLRGIPDEGSSILVGGRRLEFIPAHYLHASANFHLYDPEAKILFSGDVGAALLPAGHGPWIDRRGQDDNAFAKHIAHARHFHQRWMPSNAAKRDWLSRVRRLEIDFLCPQHGAIYSGGQVQAFFDWFADLDLGTAIHAGSA